MIEQKLTTYFSRYKKLSPRAEFVMQSKLKITTEVQQLPAFSWGRRLFESATTGGALALASFLLILILGSISYVNKGGPVVASGDPETQALMREASTLVASVEIKEVDRFTESSIQVVSALDTLSNASKVQ